MVDLWYATERIPQPQTIYPCTFCQHFSSIQPKRIQWQPLSPTKCQKTTLLTHQPLVLPNQLAIVPNCKVLIQTLCKHTAPMVK